MADTPERGSAPLHVIKGGSGSDRADRIARLNELHQGRMAALETRFGGRIAESEHRLNTINARWDAIQAEVDRQPRYARGWFYWPFMTALMLFEVPVNRLSFELFFQESPTIALGVAFLVGVILVFLAHLIGVMICRFGYHASRKKGSWIAQTMQIALLSVVVLSIVYGVSVLRQGYLDFETQPDVGFAAMLSGTGGMASASELFRAGLGLSGWIFFAINMGIIAVGMTASFLSHDPHPDFQRADISRKRAERELRAIRNQRADAEAIEKRRHANQLHRAGA